MAMSHAYTLQFASCPIPLPEKKFAPSLTGDNHAQSSHWNNGKTKIAYNSAYAQTEMFNFTLAQQDLIVYVNLCSNFQEIAPGMPNNKVQADYCFANNVGLYINSQQTINGLSPLTLH